MTTPCPQQLRRVAIGEATSKRVDALVRQHGFRRALLLLKISEHTLAEARSEGTMLQRTVDKIRGRLTELGA